MHDAPPPAPVPGPLEGVRVVDLTTVVMGPLATRILGDLGADVIKVETPEGDIMRHVPGARSAAMSGITLNLDRNKRSIVLDLKQPDQRERLLELLDTADVFVTNVRRSALGRLGLDPDELRRSRPGLIVCVANGYASDGPRADEAAYDDVIQAAAGLAGMFAWTGEPRLVPSILADKIAGLHIVYAVVTALFARTRSGIGDLIEVPMAEALAALNLVEHLDGATFVPPEGPVGYRRVANPNRAPRATADGWMVILPYSDRNWADYFAFVGRPDLTDDPRFATSTDRVTHAEALYGLVDECAGSHTTEEWMAFCTAHSIPATPVVTPEALVDDEYFAAVGLLREEHHPTEGAYRVIADPVRWSSGRRPLQRHAPHLGEHTAEILAELDERTSRTAQPPT